MISIIDYGVGNIQAIVNIYKSLHIPVKAVKDKDGFESTEKLILPGVGSFDHAMCEFEKSGMKNVVEEMVIQRKIPILGICVGMQMLADRSDEGIKSGLGWISGQVKSFATMNLPNLPMPHMGWNDVIPEPNSKLFSGIENDSKFYFLHSYFFECANREDSIATAFYGNNFSCTVNREHIYGAQFHPEKSHRYGISLLKNFAEL